MAVYYDFIGDVHGHAQELRLLLQTLGYEETDGVYRHPDRQAIFIGDLVDRGPASLEVVGIVRAMVEEGSAQICAGNHDFSTVTYLTTYVGADGAATYYLPHTASNDKNRESLMREIEADPDAGASAVAWMKTLPLFLELEGGIVAVHACRSETAIATLRERGVLDARNAIVPEKMHEALLEGTPENDAITLLLNGPNVHLARSYVDMHGVRRRNMRTRWWNVPENDPLYLREVSLERNGVTYPDIALSEDHKALLRDCQHDAPVVFGHYWLEEIAFGQGGEICVDTSVARGGKLSAVCVEVDNGRVAVTGTASVTAADVRDHALAATYERLQEPRVLAGSAAAV